MLIYLEGASQSPENCLADPKRTADPSLRTTGIENAFYKHLLKQIDVFVHIDNMC